MKASPDNEEAPDVWQVATSDKETFEGGNSLLADSIRLARTALTQEEFREWMESLRFSVDYAQTGLEHSMELYREYVPREAGQ